MAEIKSHLEAFNDLYFDTVSQIELPIWSRGRVALVGDAAYCPSLLGGEGSAFAMAGAYLLPGSCAAPAAIATVPLRPTSSPSAPLLNKSSVPQGRLPRVLRH